jgi:DNA modification methylase
VLAVNVAPTISLKGPDCDPARPLASWLTLKLREQGWLVRQPIVWVKVEDGVPISRNGILGSIANLRLRPSYDLILLASKDCWRRPSWQRWWQKPLPRDLLKDAWLLPPTPRPERGEPPTFPDELVERLLHIFSDPGDLIVYPCAGFGTASRVARANARRALLIKREPSYWPRLRQVVGDADLSARG